MAVHSHTTYSPNDGLAEPRDHLEAARQKGLKGLAITDHKMTSGWLKFEEASKEIPEVTPMYGVELYWTEDRINNRSKDELFGTSPAHMLMFATSDEGIQNINALVTDAFHNGFYQQPRTDDTMLEKHREGIIITSGCLSGPVSNYMKIGRPDKARTWMDKMQEVFGENFFLELQPHERIKDQHHLNSFLTNKNPAARDFQFVVSNDSHYPYEGDKAAQLASTCVRNGSTIDNPQYEYDGDFWIKSYEEQHEELSSRCPYIPSWIVDQAAENLVRLTSQERIVLSKGNSLIPSFWDDPALELEEKLKVGFREKILKRFREESRVTPYRERLRYEYDLIVDKGFCEYFLVVEDMVAFARGIDMLIGCGRGSAGGSLVAYLLGITDVDPIKWDLSFTRFISPDRGGDEMTFHNADLVTEMSDAYLEAMLRSGRTA